MYAIMLSLKDKKVVVIGGGKIATRKVKTLLQEEADITVVSLGFTDELIEMQEQGKVTLVQKDVSKQDFLDAFFVIAATNNPAVNQYVVRNVQAHQLLNVVDDSELGNVIIPAQLSRGKLSIAVSTNGASPTLTKQIKKELSQQYDESYEQYTEFLNQCRLIIKKSILPPGERKALLQEIAKDEYRLSPSLQSRFLQELQEQ